MGQTLRWVPSVLLGLMVSWAGGVSAQVAPGVPGDRLEMAQSADGTAPAEIVETLTQIDAAANQADLETVLRFYSPNFRTSDGLTYENLEQNLAELWERYPNLTYQTQLNSWEADGLAIVIETTTTITGSQSNADRPQTLNSTITSRQRLENSLIVEQEILSEQTQVMIGDSPPVVEVLLPEQVSIGQTFEFDAIVQEPLGNRLLLGAAIDERVQSEGYFAAVPISLEVLSSGGLFKLGRAPAAPDSHWISAVLIREDGITTVTQRLRIVRPGGASLLR
ncbi:nuclear transport factor 2 family protein [Egbenema bharatensis]|uniref:nuclear transport factor 2 family protein n=1 Tax=Egbenema bharatensis TaxID=3463334 RepID=UPI003A8851D0